MPTSQNATPLYPFENPVHALVPLGMGLIFWMIGTAAREVAKQPDRMREINRHNPWTILFKGRPNTVAEERSQLPNWFFRTYGLAGLMAVWIGYALGAFGASGLVVSLAKKLFEI